MEASYCTADADIMCAAQVLYLPSAKVLTSGGFFNQVRHVASAQGCQ